MAAIDFTGVTGPTEWMDRVFAAALDNGWSDLQLRLARDEEILALGREGDGSVLTVRARVNRKMLSVAALKGRNADAVVTRVKSVSGIGSGPAIEPKDGLYKYRELNDDDTPRRGVDVRVAVFPTFAGETLALRLPSADAAVSMEDLRFTAHNRTLIDRSLGLSNGLILVAGPMGSGKSTTMRTFLRKLGGPEMSVWTVEDPVEMEIEGVEQISINAEAGNGWKDVLTGLRRSDLEVLMIGEIRNLEQASAALEIGNAGAKVLSSIHANDSVGAVMQLMELADAKPRTLGAQLRSVISQRLLRTFCTTCGGPDNAAGCTACDSSGYKGLRPIHEILLMTEEFTAGLAAGATIPELRAVAARDGMLTLRQCAQEVVDEGSTSLEEVWRVLGDD